MEQFVLVLLLCKTSVSIPRQLQRWILQKIKLQKNPDTKLIHLGKEINKKLFTKADSLVDKILPCPRIKLSNSQTLLLDSLKISLLLSDFPQQLRCQNAEVPDNYFTSLDAAGKSPTLVLNQNAKAKE